MIREQIDEVLKRPIGEEQIKFLVENKAHLTDKELKMLGFVPAEPLPGPEIPLADKAELDAMPKRSEEEVKKSLKKKK